MRNIKIVSGYHKETNIPKEAGKLHLATRFAVILDTYRPDSADMYFDLELFMGIVSGLSSVIGADAVSVQCDDGKSFDSLEAFNSYSSSLSQEECEPPKRITFIKNKEIIGLEQTEFWTLAGGPAPYHDSYTASFYTAIPMAAAFETACRAACARLGGEVTEVIAASPLPIKVPFWEKLVNKLLGRS